jgi:hypothetical protein
MSTRESQPERQPAQPGKFGIDRLSARGIGLLFEFVTGEATSYLRGDALQRYSVLVQEWQQVTSRDPQGVAARIVAMGRANNPFDRQVTTDIVPYLAEKIPDEGFTLWRDLLQDDEEFVRDSAIQALAKTVGVLDLEPEHVVALIELHNQEEVRRGRYAPGDCQHPPAESA